MRKIALASILLLIGATQVYAEACRPEEKLELVANVSTGNDSSGAYNGQFDILTETAHEIRLIAVTCSSTACVAGLYDADSNDLTPVAVDGTPKIEPGTPASQVVLLPQSGFFEQPLSFENGIVFRDDGNVAAISLYECIGRGN